MRSAGGAGASPRASNFANTKASIGLAIHCRDLTSGIAHRLTGWYAQYLRASGVMTPPFGSFVTAAADFIGMPALTQRVNDSICSGFNWPVGGISRPSL